MKMKKFLVPYITDERMVYAQEYLSSLGYEITDTTDNADFILLPIPAKKYMFDGLDGKTVFYGSGDYKGLDYNKKESFLLENAYLTAEGAVALFKENYDTAIFRSKILITGYGRIAQALHKILEAMGADVTICSRSSESESRAVFSGGRHITFDELKNPSDFDAVFNTVPHIVFTKNELNSLKKGVKIFDLASFPGGVDTLCAKSTGVEIIDGRKLPSRYSKKSAGYLIGKTVHQMIKEDLS